MGLSARVAALSSVRACGPALMMTTVIYGAACLGNLASSIVPFQVFGVTLALITALALLIDLLITPALLVLAFADKAVAGSDVAVDPALKKEGIVG